MLESTWRLQKVISTSGFEPESPGNSSFAAMKARYAKPLHHMDEKVAVESLQKGGRGGGCMQQCQFVCNQREPRGTGRLLRTSGFLSLTLPDSARNVWVSVLLKISVRRLPYSLLSPVFYAHSWFPNTHSSHSLFMPFPLMLRKQHTCFTGSTSSTEHE